MSDRPTKPTGEDLPDPDPDPIRTSARKERQLRRLPPGAACGLCGGTEPAVLKLVKPPRSLLEGHHAGLKVIDPNTLIVLCLNCHWEATNAQLDVGALQEGRPSSLLERLAMWLKSIGSFFRLLAEACFRFAARLETAIIELDTNLPGWRGLPGLA